MKHFVVFLTFCLAASNAAKILCYFPNPSRSHVLLALPIAEELAKRGHQLTVVTNHKYGLGGPNYREIVIETRGIHGELFEQMNSGKAKKSISFLTQVVGQFRDDNVETLKSTVFQKIMQEESFDLVFFIQVFFNNYQLGVADHFKAPWVALNPMGNIYAVRELLGLPSLTSTVPSKFADMPNSMTFLNRLMNFLGLFPEMLMTKYFECKAATLYDELWPSDRYRSFNEMKGNASAIFLNGHWTENKIIRPTLPNEVDIGGIQISAKPKALEADVQTFLDEAEHGVILWTFGSNVPISKIDSQKLKIMMKVLTGLKQKVLLKWEDDSKLPKNFMGRNWLAQDSILAHKNVKLFITHGGHGGSMEAMYHQVPILGIPFFGDQHGNVAKAVADGWAHGMTLDELTEKKFSDAVADLLTNNKYRENVKKLSEMYSDRLNGPLESAVFWVEYALKYHGAPHLSYAGRHLNFFQTYSLDVIAVVLIILYALLLIVKKIFQVICRKMCGKKADKKDKRKKRE